MAKKKDISRFEAWDEVAIALKEIRDIEISVKQAETLMNQAISDIKQAYEDKVSDQLERKADLENQIELYTKAHINEFTDKKSKDFTFGKAGFRKTTEITARNVVAIIEACKQRKMTDCIITKESLDKDMLAKYDDGALQTVGAKRKESEKYYMEVKLEELQ